MHIWSSAEAVPDIDRTLEINRGKNKAQGRTDEYV